MPEDSVTSAEARGVQFRGGGFAPVPIRWLSAIGLVGLVALWQVASSLGWISPLIAPSPAAVGVALWGLVESGELWPNLGASLQRLALGWGLGTVAGLAVGFALGMSSVSRALGLPLVSALFPIPKIALLPLFIIWFGIGEPSKVATIAFGVFFPTVINAYSGVDNVPRNLIRMGQSFNLPTGDVVRKIVLPGAMPAILAGFRISASIAIILLVAAEMIGAEYGIGALILSAGHLMQTDMLLAGVVILSLLGLTVGAVLGWAERRLLRWR